MVNFLFQHLITLAERFANRLERIEDVFKIIIRRKMGIWMIEREREKVPDRVKRNKRTGIDPER